MRVLAPWNCCKVFCILVVTVKTCTLRETTKKVVNFFAPLNLPPTPPWKKSCGRPWLLLMAQPIKHHQSDSAVAHCFYSACWTRNPVVLKATFDNSRFYSSIALSTAISLPMMKTRVDKAARKPYRILVRTNCSFCNFARVMGLHCICRAAPKFVPWSALNSVSYVHSLACWLNLSS